MKNSKVQGFLLAFLVLTYTFSAFAERRIVTCPSYSEDEGSGFADLARELVLRDLRGFRVTGCHFRSATFYSYLSNKVSKDGDHVGRVSKSDSRVKVISEKGSEIHLNRISRDDYGVYTVTFSVEYKSGKKKKQNSDMIKFMLLDGELPQYESCADIVSHPQKIFVFDTCK